MRLCRAIGRLRWLRLGLRRRLVRALFPPGASPSIPFEVPYHGMAYRGDIANAQEWHVYFFGGYELKESALIADLLAAMPGAVALDIGANLGGHAYTMAAGAVRVHAFEPFGPLADQIEEQLGRNHIGNVTVHRIGLGELDEDRSYFLDLASTNSGTGSFLAEHTGADAVACLPVRRGDTILEGVAPDFVKIDIEGFEAPALVGLRETLARGRPAILMEVTESSAALCESHGGLEAILPFGYTLYRVCNPDHFLGLFPLGEYRLRPIARLQPEPASHNVLIVPEGSPLNVARLARTNRNR